MRYGGITYTKISFIWDFVTVLILISLHPALSFLSFSFCIFFHFSSLPLLFHCCVVVHQTFFCFQLIPRLYIIKESLTIIWYSITRNEWLYHWIGGRKKEERTRWENELTNCNGRNESGGSKLLPCKKEKKRTKTKKREIGMGERERNKRREREIKSHESLSCHLI